MHEILANFPDNVVAAAAHGVVTRRDYQDILVPRVELTLKRHPKIRYYYEPGPEFSRMEAGAMWRISKSGSSIPRGGSAWQSSRTSIGSSTR